MDNVLPCGEGAAAGGVDPTGKVAAPQCSAALKCRLARGGDSSDNDRVSKLSWPAPERNKQPILEVLSRVLPAQGTLLELASGTGQHAAHFARHLPAWTIQPSDISDENLQSIRAWVRESALPNLREPVRLDVVDADWNAGQPTAIFNANMIHIAPWETAEGLFRGAQSSLASGGLLVLYGPFRIAGQHTAPSNEAFDQSLRERDARFGVRDLEAVTELAARFGFRLRERIAMPANNQTLVFERS